MDELRFREFDAKDISKCSELVVDAWPIVNALGTKEDVNKFISIFIELTLLSSTWREVVCVSDNIIGLLFGRINSDYRNKFKAFFSILSIGMKIILWKYKGVSKRLTLLRKIISTEIKVMLNSPKSDGEVTFFIVDSKYRGKGIGRMSMDRFIDTAKKKNAKMISVYTEQESNWRFYENYGFRKYRTFYDDMTSFFRKEDINGFIYTINLQ
ncbi:MAG: GNAT family N-acetyltransferase [Candidatus Atribacteria bacterium]|nr:GNAT family N-acetyltransferase [Candidatus Atribacteria bacterium]